MFSVSLGKESFSLLLVLTCQKLALIENGLSFISGCISSAKSQERLAEKGCSKETGTLHEVKKRIEGIGNSKAVQTLKLQRIKILDGGTNGNWIGMVRT